MDCQLSDNDVEIVEPSSAKPAASNSRAKPAASDSCKDRPIDAKPRLAIAASNFRNGRCALSARLGDPACEDERFFWKDSMANGLSIGNSYLPKGIQSVDQLKTNDLEDYAGYYSILGCSNSFR